MRQRQSTAGTKYLAAKTKCICLKVLNPCSLIKEKPHYQHVAMQLSCRRRLVPASSKRFAECVLKWTYQIILITTWCPLKFHSRFCLTWIICSYYWWRNHDIYLLSTFICPVKLTPFQLGYLKDTLNCSCYFQHCKPLTHNHDLSYTPQKHVTPRLKKLRGPRKSLKLPTSV